MNERQGCQHKAASLSFAGSETENFRIPISTGKLVLSHRAPVSMIQ